MHSGHSGVSLPSSTPAKAETPRRRGGNHRDGSGDAEAPGTQAPRWKRKASDPERLEAATLKSRTVTEPDAEALCEPCPMPKRRRRGDGSRIAAEPAKSRGGDAKAKGPGEVSAEAPRTRRPGSEIRTVRQCRIERVERPKPGGPVEAIVWMGPRPSAAMPKGRKSWKHVSRKRRCFRMKARKRPMPKAPNAKAAMIKGRGGGWLPKLGHPFALACPAGWRPCRDTLLIH